jgi:hypothetical protein
MALFRVVGAFKSVHGCTTSSISNHASTAFFTIIRLAGANRVRSCAVFLANPQQRSFLWRNRFLATWKGCSTTARTRASVRSTGSAKQPACEWAMI